MTHFGKRGIYSGIRFASQLEARHAIFFDLLGVRWQYEPNNANFFCGGVEYKPDFYLPEQRIWLEVKGAGKSNWLDRAMSKASALASFSGQHVFVSINVIPRPDKVLSDRWNMLHFAGITDACLASWSVCLRCGRYFCYSSTAPQCPFCGRGHGDECWQESCVWRAELDRAYQKANAGWELLQELVKVSA